jgi:predicted lipoprotein with Yx(FWY)xxD motif
MNTNNSFKTSNKPLSLIGVLAALSMILAACATGTTPASTPSVAQPAVTQSVSSGSTVSIDVATDPTLGKILVDDKGMTLYVFTKDEPDKSNCDAACMAKWPPLMTTGTPKVGPGVDASLIGTGTLADGNKVITYDHKPLYYWVNDTKPGDTTGQGVGGVWYVVSPTGQEITPSPESIPTQAPSASFTEPSINVATDPKLGQILVDGKGMTLYIFTKDGRDQSNCDADCLAKWPPLLTKGDPSLGSGVDASKVGSATLADGSMIVTYDHRPLYVWIKDTKPGDTTGQGVGSVWYVISPSGQEIDDSPQAVADPSPDPVPSSTEPTLNVATDPKLGQILVDGKGMTLYIFTRDLLDVSNCSGDCLVSWPPLLTQGNPILGAGVDDSKVGSALLADGTMIVTYNHMPLYYWIKDTKPGDTTGQGVGSVWYVLSPDGEIIGK